MRSSFLIAIFTLLCSLALAQAPVINHCLMPPDYLVNEEFCFTLDLEESATVGFGPYLRIMLPPGMELTNAAFGGGATLNLIGTSTGAPLKDPHRNSGTLADSVTLAPGWTFWVLDYPVGSMTVGGVGLQTLLCLKMDPNIVTIGQPVPVLLQAGYIYGDTPTGIHGPTLGPVFNGNVVPLLYLYFKTSAPLPRHDRTPGPDWPLLYSLVLNIADSQTVTGIVYTDILPPALMYIPGSISVPTGCTANTTGIVPGLPGGSFSVTCPSGLGTLAADDMVVHYAGYATDVLDEGLGGGGCDKYKIVNVSHLNTNQGATVVGTDTVKIYNLTMQLETMPITAVPGTVLTSTVDIQVSDYITAMDSLRLTIRVQDGLDFLGNCMLDSVPVTPTAILNNYPTAGWTWVEFDLVSLHGSNIQPGDSLKLTYQTQVRQNYQAAPAQVLAQDVLSNFAAAHYHLTDELPGTQGCDYNYRADISIIPNSITKYVVGGTDYDPGESVTYCLQMILPSGDANNVVFTDYFPIPIHTVQGMNLTWGGPQIWPGPAHNGVNPINITTIPGNNALVIDFGNVASFTSPETLQVYVSIPVTTVPFANGLIHSNFLQVESDNTDLMTTSQLQLTQIHVGAPELALTKGVTACDNPHAWLTAPTLYPPNSDLNAVDAGDTVTFVSTIQNVGGAKAYGIRLVDPVPAQFSGCQLVSVLDMNGGAVSYTGQLFTAPNDTLVIDSMGAVGADSVVSVTYTCEVRADLPPQIVFTNTMSMAWAAAIGQDSLFDWVRDSARVVSRPPLLTKDLVRILPNHAHQPLKAHIGEELHYVAEVVVPEGEMDSLILRDGFGQGLALAMIDSIVVSPGLSSSLGPIASILPVVDSLGFGNANWDRRMIFHYGKVTNADRNNQVDERIAIYYRSRALNLTAVQRGDSLRNDVHMSHKIPAGQWINNYDYAAFVDVVEPELELVKSFAAAQAAPGDEVMVSLTLRHALASDATAFDVLVTDTLPLGLNMVPGSFTANCSSTFAMPPTYNLGVVMALLDSLTLGSPCEIRYKLAVDQAFPPCSTIVNKGNLYWESVYDPMQALLAACPTNPNGTDRTGFANAPGQSNPYSAQSTDSLQVGMAFNGLPQLTTNSPVCLGQPITLNCTPYLVQGVSYIWTTPTGTDTTALPQYIIPNATALDSGYYAVTVSLGNCASATSTQALVQVVAPPTVMVMGSGSFCEGGDAPLSAVALPAGSYTYLWQGPNGYISTQQNPILTGLTMAMAGAYTVQASANGCTSAWSQPVNVNVLPRPVLQVDGDTLACSYGVIDMVLNATAISGTGPFTYYWTGPGGFASTMEDAIIPNAREMHEGNYICTMTDSLGCQSLPMTAVMDIHDAPATPVITQQGALCPGDMLTLVTTAYAGASVDYYWITPGGPVTTTVPSLNIPSVTLSDAGLYSVNVEVDGCLSLTSALSTVVIHAAPSQPNPVALYGNPLGCAGDTLWLSAQGDSSHTYTWSGPNGFAATGMQALVPAADPAYNGSYQVTVTNGNCTTVGAMTLNAILPYPTTPSIQQPATACEGDAVVLQANPYNGTVVDYQWSTPAGNFSSIAPSWALIPVQPSDSGLYTLSVNVNGCNSLPSGAVYLTVNPLPAAPQILLNAHTLCEGDTLLLSTPNIPGATYTWSGPGGYNSSNQVPPAVMGVTPMHTGYFELFVVVNSCRSALTTDSILVYGRPATPTLTLPGAGLCDGQPIVLSSNGLCDSSLFIPPTGYSPALYSNPQLHVQGNSTSLTSSNAAYGAGAWSVVCIDANGCASLPSASAQLTLQPTPAAPSLVNPAPVCEGYTVVLNATSNAPQPIYAWTGPGGFTFQGANPVIPNASLGQGGLYGVIVQSQGCTSDTTWATVVVDTVPATPNPSVSGAACAGGNLQLLANCSANGYFWTGPNGFVSSLQNPILQGVDASNDGFYQLMVIAAACTSDVGIVNVHVTDNSGVPAIAAGTTFCEGSPITLQGNPVSGSNVAYLWTCPGPMYDTTATAIFFDSLATLGHSGWYTLNVLVDGCLSPASAPLQVTVNPSPATPVISGPDSVCTGGNIVLGTPTLAAGYVWLGPNNYGGAQQQPPVITNAQSYNSGLYTLQVIQNGCPSSDASVWVTVLQQPATPVLQTNSPVCIGDTLRLSTQPGASQYNWLLPGGTLYTTQVPFLNVPAASPAMQGACAVYSQVGGCPSIPSAAVDVEVSGAGGEQAYAGEDMLVCNGQSTATLSAGNHASGGFWTGQGGAVIVSPGHAQTLVTHLEPGQSYVFHWTLAQNGCQSSSEDSIHVTVPGSILAVADAYEITAGDPTLNAPVLSNDSFLHAPVTLQLIAEALHGGTHVNPGQTLGYSPADGFIGVDSAAYQVCYVACPEMCSSAFARFTVGPRIYAPDLITPNGDGINDAFAFVGLENFPQHSLAVFNRWGAKVYESTDYHNDWQGTWRGNYLPDGTYFWVLVDPGTMTEILRGYLTIQR